MFTAIVLAGGAGRRMGDARKPLLPVRGTPMLRTVLDALTDADRIVVVGPSWVDEQLPANALRTLEDPPGGGPVAAIAAGFAKLRGADEIGVFAGDMPLLTRDAVRLLRGHGGDVAMFVDGDGRRQSLCAVWRASSLERRLVGIPPDGRAMHDLLAGADVREVRFAGAGLPPWFDCDTPDEVRFADGAG